MAQQDASDALSNQLLNTLTIFVGLSSTPPNDTDGSNITPPPVADYQRASPTFGTASARKRTTTTNSNFVSGDGLADSNAANQGWATFHSAVSGGTFYGSCQLSQALAWVLGQPVTMATGDVSVEFEAPS